MFVLIYLYVFILLGIVYYQKQIETLHYKTYTNCITLTTIDHHLKTAKYIIILKVLKII